MRLAIRRLWNVEICLVRMLHLHRSIGKLERMRIFAEFQDGGKWARTDMMVQEQYGEQRQWPRDCCRYRTFFCRATSGNKENGLGIVAGSLRFFTNVWESLWRTKAMFLGPLQTSQTLSWHEVKMCDG